MTDPKKRADLDDLGQRIAAARQGDERRKGGSRDNRDTQNGLGLGLRLASEMVAGLIVGVGLGLGLDHWLGTGPWLLILFFVLGSAAGLMNVIRVARAHDAARRAERDAARDAGMAPETAGQETATDRKAVTRGDDNAAPGDSGIRTARDARETDEEA